MIETHAQSRSANFGTMPNGQSVEAWTLKGAGGLELEILTLGGIVRRLAAPDRNGSFADLVLGYPDLEPYLENPAYFGATIGRVAGRIAGGTLKFGSEAFQLPVNNPPNHLHGGPGALHTRVWKAEPVERPDGAPSLKLSCESPDGDQGYPGNLKVAVTYTVTAANEFVFETFVESDRATPASITHHSYFNLAGEGNGTILDHRAQIYSSQIIPSDEAMTLLNRLEPVDGRAADMRTPVRLGTVIPGLWQSHGDLYWIGTDKTLRQAARIEDPSTGRVLDVRTTNSCLQTFFSSSLDGSIRGKAGRPYERFGAFCLECEEYPEATNVTGFGDILVRPGQPQHHTTIYAFGTV